MPEILGQKFLQEKILKKTLDPKFARTKSRPKIFNEKIQKKKKI